MKRARRSFGRGFVVTAEAFGGGRVDCGFSDALKEDCGRILVPPDAPFFDWRTASSASFDRRDRAEHYVKQTRAAADRLGKSMIEQLPSVRALVDFAPTLAVVSIRDRNRVDAGVKLRVRRP